MLLCAGFGTRLRPLTDELPKPLVPIGDRPILGHIAATLAAAGFERAVANVHHLAERFEEMRPRLPLELQLLHEPAIRGTAGGVAGARDELGPDSALVWNADVLLEPPIAELLRVAERTNAMCLCVAPRARGEGTVGVDDTGRLVRLRGERFGVEHAGGDYVGVLALGRAALAALPDHGCLFGDFALPELRRGRPVFSVVHEGAWTDAGSLDAYARANWDWLHAHEPSAAGYVAPGADVAGDVTLRHSIIGSAARVRGRGVLERCVVWPGAGAEAPLSDAVVTGEGRVVSLLKA